LRTRDGGISWEEISPDLTRNMDEKQGKGGEPYTNEAVGAENYGTIAYITESPHEKGVLWTGSDDGLVHLTKDGGATWKNVTPKGLRECLVNAVEVSPHDPATAYIATTRYKFNDYTPGIYKTTNYGESWTNISSGIPYGAFTRVVREDASRKNLLYAGTEKGIFISWDGGNAWEPLQLNLPVTPITDLMVHKGDLIVATSGRSFWILDDLGVLNQFDPKRKELNLFSPEDAYNGSWGSPLNGDSKKFKGTDPFDGVNPANGMVIYYELPKGLDSTSIALEIRDEKGELVRQISSEKDKNYKKHHGGGPPMAPVLSKNTGLNRFVWDMRTGILPGIPDVYIEANFKGHVLPPGKYSLLLKAGELASSVTGNIVRMPGISLSEDSYREHHLFMNDAEAKLTKMHKTINSLFDAQRQLKDILKMVSDSTLKSDGKKLVAALDTWDKDMIQRKSQAYDDVENFPNKFSAEYLFMMNHANSTIPGITASSEARKQELDAQWEPLRLRAEAFVNEEIPAYNKQLWEAGIGAIRIK
ncbi:MAG: glycosyl hydrolase, partial [Eudoraea sp.]|nr:glycosyl hydrolase [Eudoraea sp.]